MREINFVHLESTEKIVNIALTTQTNLILHGPGGYGKTELVKHYLKKLNLTANFVVGYKNMVVEALLGIPDMDKLMNNSEYSIAFEHSVFKGAEVLVLEEFLDVLPETAAALKDIITEGGYRQKGEFIKSDIKTVIIVTNKDPEEIENDDSLRAFYMERFPFRHRVAWENNSLKKYYDLLTTNTDLPNNVAHNLSHICSLAKPSPRIALTAASLYLFNNSFEEVKLIEDLKNVDITSLVNVLEDIDYEKSINDKLQYILKLVAANYNNLGGLLYLKSKVVEIPVNDIGAKHAGRVMTILGTLTQHIDNLNNEFMVNTDTHKISKIDDAFRDLIFQTSP